MSEAKASRMVSDRVAITNTVVAAIDIHGPEIAPTLEKILFPGGVPGDLTLATLLAAFGNHLRARANQLVTADRTHMVELSDDDGYRAKRDECTAETRDFLGTLRTGLARNYGQVVAGAYGLGAHIPEDPHTVLVLADNVENLLRNRPLTEPPKNKSLKIDPIAAADDLNASASALKTALGDVDREKREAQLTQTAKNEAMAAWGTSYSGVADAAASFFLLAGRPALAERVRPTARRRAGLPEPEDTVGGGSDAAGGGTTP
ncbi:hypothetical protein [Polyangium sp. y55x31]|uniref:hypothetical protein n=1 Tax=Polyangium sp. y55x31 TaxID=3042688 RepID=UPI002482A1E8|nr:hypothetical protein [Polyangium sp. y55x31]MDI1477113.1 hypothetical protein [Polyangium sp. y55x31]